MSCGIPFFLNTTKSGAITIILLTFLIGYILFNYTPVLKVRTLLVLPYFLWLLVACSLNAYIFFKN